MNDVLTSEQMELMERHYGTSASAEIARARKAPALGQEQIDAQIARIMRSKSEDRDYVLVPSEESEEVDLEFDGKDDVVMVTEIRQTDRGADAPVRIELTTRGWCEYFIGLQYWSLVDAFRGEDNFKVAVEEGKV